LHVYAEVVVKNKDAYAFAREFIRAAGRHRFEAYIIDKKGAQPRALGRSNTTAEHYTAEFKRAGVIPSRLSGTGFLFSSPDVDARELSVKAMLGDGRLKIHRGSTSTLDRQIKGRYYDMRNPTRRETRTEHAFFDGGLYHHHPQPVKDAQSRYDKRVTDFIEQEKRGGPHRRVFGFASV
jgi:hypothetical protein